MGTYIVIGFMLDYLLGDPYRLPHPVRIIGRFISWLESIIRRINLNRTGLKIAGVFLTLITVSLTYAITWWSMRLAWLISPWLYAVVCTIVVYYSLSVRSLAKESGKVYIALNKGDYSLARERLSAIVSRDTRDLDEKGIIRGAVETVAENTVDGVLAPMFYLFLGGPALGMAYKAVNTLDSMVGYMSERYRELGWASAKLDDITNWLPARIAGIIMPIAGGVWGKDAGRGYKIYHRDKNKHKSPNAGHPEAAMAGLLGVSLGGISTYFDEVVEKPVIGEANNSLEPGHILDAIRIMKTTAFLGLIVFFLVATKFGFR